MSESNSIYIVYRTTNLVNNYIYIGVHKQKFHFPILFDGYFGSGIALGKAIKKYGKENFVRETLFVYYTPEEAYAKEKELVDEAFIKRKDTYNMCGGGFGASIITDEQKQKMSEAHKGNKLSEETKLKMSKSQMGKHRQCSEETKHKLRMVNTGENNPNFGLKRSEETKRKMSEAQRGENNPNFGKNLPEEQKQKIRESLLGKKHPITQCPHCGKTGGQRAMKQWHFDNCKYL